MNWREWEGRTVDGKYVLGNYLGGSHGSAVFRTRVASGPSGSGEESAEAAIKVVALGGAEAESQLRRWKSASELSHPNLLRILAMGRAAGEVLYVVEEFAEENLAQIIPERALTAEEVRGMLGPVLGALEYVHGKGMVHGRINPSNILAAGDLVKLSSDSLRRPGEVPRRVGLYDAPEAAMGVLAASDVWSLGMTLVEVLTRRPPAWDAARMKPPEIGDDVPEPYRGIARCCLEVDPAKRCEIRGIEERLEGKQDAPKAVVAPVASLVKADAPIEVVAAASKSAKWPYWILLAVLVAGSIFLIVLMRSSTKPASKEVSISSQEAPTESRPSQVDTAKPNVATTAPAGAPSSQEARRPGPVSAPGDAGPVGGAVSETKTASDDEIVERVMPKISASAQRTITGKIKVRVKVKVDAAGDVAQASLKEAGLSKYFAREAVDAARRWRFTPAVGEEAREWTLLFVFSRARTEVMPSRGR